MPSRPIVNTAGYAPTLATHFIVLAGSQMSLASASSPALRELRHEPHLRQLGDRPPTSGRGDLDFTSQLSRIKASGADFMVDWSRYAEGALIIKQMKQMAIDMPYFGSDGQAHPKFRELSGSAAEGAYYP